MPAYFVYLQDRLRSSFWLVPSLMTLIAMPGAFFMLWLDTMSWSNHPFWWMASPAAGAEGARLTLSTIAGSMITVASLVFSMTLVTLTLAASSIGPRLLDRFMDNRINQIALGLFLATFVYSLLILRATTSGEPPFIPHISVAFAMLMAILSFGWLIIFIHDLSRSIQVDNVVAELAQELMASFEDLAKQHPNAVDVPYDRESSATTVTAEQSGYVQAVSTGKLLKLAKANDVLIKMHCKPGDFVIPSRVVAHLIGPLDDKLANAVRKTIILGPKRTAAQDAAFSVNVIVEIAARALSPGVNDFFTALTCIDHLTSAFDVALKTGLPGNGFKDDTGKLRLVLYPITNERLINKAFHPLRHSAIESVPVVLKLLENLTHLMEGRSDHPIAKVIEHHGYLIHQTAISLVSNEADRSAIDDQYAVLQVKLRGQTGQQSVI